MNIRFFLALSCIAPITIYSDILIEQVINKSGNAVLRNLQKKVIRRYPSGIQKKPAALLSRAKKRKLILETPSNNFTITTQNVMVNEGHDSFIAIMIRGLTSDYVQSLLISNGHDKAINEVKLELHINQHGIPCINLSPDCHRTILERYKGSYNDLVQKPVIEICMGGLDQDKLHVEKKEVRQGHRFRIMYDGTQSFLSVQRRSISALPVPLIEVTLENEESVQQDSLVLFQKDTTGHPIAVLKQNENLELKHY